MSLAVDFCGIHFDNPFFVASQVSVSRVDPQGMADLLRRHVDAGAGAVCTPCILSLPGSDGSRMEPARRMIAARGRPPFHQIGLFGLALNVKNLCNRDFGLELLYRLRGIGVPIIANVMGGSTDPATWASIAREMVAEGANMLELDTSCPLSAGEFEGDGEFPRAPGFLVGQVPSLLREITRAVKKAVDVPVMVKMTPEIGYPQLIHAAQVIKDAGADAISAINAPVSIAPPDLRTRGRSSYPFTKRFNFSAAFGPWDRFLMYKFVAAISLHVRIPVSAVGGILDPEHAVEAMLLGARTVQFSSGILWRGVKLIRHSKSFLQRYLEEQEFGSVEELVGASHRYIGEVEYDDFARAYPVLEENKCTLCGICAETTCMALSITGQRLVLDKALCTGCNLCVVNCPTDAWQLTLVANDAPVGSGT